jgi:hypothetical protein
MPICDDGEVGLGEGVPSRDLLIGFTSDKLRSEYAVKIFLAGLRDLLILTRAFLASC